MEAGDFDTPVMSIDYGGTEISWKYATLEIFCHFIEKCVSVCTYIHDGNIVLERSLHETGCKYGHTDCPCP